MRTRGKLRKLLSLALALLFVLALLPVGVSAAGSNWEIKELEDGSAEITAYYGSASALSIPESINGLTVSRIGQAVFSNNTVLESVTIADTVTCVGFGAFIGCTNLASVVFSENLTEISPNAFKNCTSLTELNLPEGLLTIGVGSNDGGAFNGCTSLKKIYVPSTLQSCPSGYYGANFGNCPLLNDITFGERIPKIANGLFCDCLGLTHVEIPDTVTSIGSGAFSGCTNLASVVFSENLTEISPNAFKNCSSLTELNLPEGLLTIGAGSNNGGAFNGCTSLKKIYVPSTLQSCPSGYYGANFGNCPLLNDITFGERIPKIANGLFCDCLGLTHIEIPDTVTSIGSGAFSGCTNLASVVFSENLTEISPNAFKNCSSLTELNLPEGLLTIGISSNNGGAFNGCTSLEKIYVPSTLQNCSSGYYGANFGNCPVLDNVTFGKGIPIIPNGLFCDCQGLTHIEIPSTVEKIGNAAFSGSGLISITIPDTVTSYGGTFLQNCTSLKTVKLSDSVLTIPAGMFSGCSALESVSIPIGVTKLQNDTFNGCAALQTVEIPDTVLTVGNNAFKECTSLTDITFLPWSIASIGSNAFENCTGLTSAVLPLSMKTLGNSAFKGCTSLVTFKADAALTSFGDNCFQNCAALKNVTLSNKLTVIPAYVFAGCRELESFVIPKGVTEIKNNAFYQDTKLLEFTIPKTVMAIGTNAFSYPAKTTVRGVAGSYAETFAAWKEFIDITSPADRISLATGGNSLVIPYSANFTPAFILSPNDSTDTIASLTSSNTGIVSIKNGLSLYGQGKGTADVTVVTSSGTEYTFPVTVDEVTGIEISHFPDKTVYLLKEPIDMTGLAVNIVYKSGVRQNYTGFTVSGFSSETVGTKTISISAPGYSAQFEILVCAELTPPTIASIKANKTSANTGEAITWTATASGGSGTLQYYFILYKDGVKIKTQDYSTSKTFSYTPTEPGAYKVKVYVKDATDTKANKTSTGVTVTEAAAPLAISSIKANVTNAKTGEAITWTAKAAGDSGTLQYYFILYKDGTKVKTQAYSTKNTFSYTPKGAGTFKVKVYVKDAAGTKVYKTSAGVTVTSAGPTISSVKASVTSAYAGEKITWTAAASGGSGTLKYYFILYKDGTKIKTRSYSTTKTFSYTPTEAGNYKVKVYVKDSAGAKSYKTGGKVAVTLGPLAIVSVKAGKTSSAVGEQITWTATAVGSEQPLKYYFILYKDGVKIKTRSYSTVNTFSYTPTEAGTYKVKVYVKDAAGTKVYKNSAKITVS